MPAALLDDPVDGRQSQSGSFPGLLGGEERLEHALLYFRRHAHSRVGDGDHHVRPGGNIMKGARRGFDIDVAQFQAKSSALRHGVARVDHQIHQHLFHLAGIDLDLAELPGDNRVDLHVLAQHAAKHAIHVPQRARQIHDARLQHLLAGEGQDLLGQRSGSLARGANLSEAAVRRVFRRDPPEKKIAVPQDDGEEVVEIMRDAAGQAAHGFHLDGLPQILFELLVIRR